MNSDFAAHIRRVFGRYADAPVWIAWESRPNVDPSKPPTKIPVNPHTGYPASVTDPSSWGPAGKAMAFSERRGLAGIGVVLGPDPAQNPDGSPDRPFLIGVDYDNALRPDGSLMPWAQDMMLEGTYTEVSPSGTGVKAFAVVDCRPDGLPSSQDGVTLKLGDLEPAVPGKRPAVEVYTARRWFAVTGQTFRGTDQCRIADMTRRLPVLLRHAAPAIQAATPPIPTDPDGSFTPQDARDAYATALDRDASAALTRALQTHGDLARAMIGPDWVDRSAALFTAADLAKGYKLAFEQFVHGIMAATGAAANHVRDQPDPFRALSRAWDRSPQPLPIPPPDPIPDGAQLGDRPGSGPTAYGATPVDLSMLDQPNPLGAPFTLPLDLYQNPPPLPKFILDGFFPSAPMAIVGTGGVLKSTTWMAMALHMILDRPIWGRNWWEGGSALMISKEDERDIMLRRLHDLLHGLGVTERQYRDIVARRFYLDDMTDNAGRMVESDGKGNLVVTPLTDFVTEKYRGRELALVCLDPMVNFGPGEAHGNDGAALMMQIAWRMNRAWSEDGGRCNVTYIHHLSMAAAREEVEDAHAGRSASAIGDNARSVWVMHRHKVQNAHRHVAPASIPVEAIQRGEVIRMTMAKNSYAKRIMEPFYVWRDQGACKFIEPLSPEDAQRAAATVPTQAEALRQDRETVNYNRFIQNLETVTGPQSAPTLVSLTGLSRAAANRFIARAVAEGHLIAGEGGNYTRSSAEVSPAAAYGF